MAPAVWHTNLGHPPKRASPRRVRTLVASGVTLPSAGQSPFTDLAEYPDEVQDAVDVLVTLGITTGTTDSTFSPEVELPRWQMALFLARLIEVIQAG